jgi:hypothetical protein
MKPRMYISKIDVEKREITISDTPPDPPLELRCDEPGSQGTIYGLTIPHGWWKK